MLLDLILVMLAISGAVLVGPALIWLPFMALVWLPGRMLLRLFRRVRGGVPSTESFKTLRGPAPMP